MKTLDTLVADIYSVLEQGNVKIDAARLAETIAKKLDNKPTSSELRMSNIGSPCERQLWYKINLPDKAEPLTGDVLIKFLIGDVIEEIVLSLAEAAGHTVEYRQAEVGVAGVPGHIDAILDGVLVDVKSASSRSFDKFRYHTLPDDDVFGYVPQLSLYGEGVGDMAKVKGESAFLAIDKQHGTLALDKHKRDTRDWTKYVEDKKAMVAKEAPPPRPYQDKADGASGNRVIPSPCTYCQYKKTCWPGLRSFKYAKDVKKHFTKVVRTPDVEEIT